MLANETDVGEELEYLLDIKIAHIFAVLFCSMAGVTVPLCFKSRISPGTTFVLRAFASGCLRHLGIFENNLLVTHGILETIISQAILSTDTCGLQESFWDWHFVTWYLNPLELLI
jgi:hypothetical protein